MLVEKDMTLSQTEAAAQEAVEKGPGAVAQRDEYDISLQQSPLALLLRYQWASEAIIALKEEESLSRLQLMQLHHKGFLAIARQSLFTLSQHSAAIAALQARHLLVIDVQRTPRQTTPERIRRTRGHSSGSGAGGSNSMVTEDVSGGGRRLRRGRTAASLSECDEGMTMRHLQRVRGNHLRRIAQGIHEKRRQVRVFAEHEIRRIEAKERRARLFSLKAPPHGRFHPLMGERKPNTPRAKQWLKTCETKQGFAHARVSQFLEKRNKRQRSVLQLEEMVCGFLKESQTAFEKEVNELQSTAAHVREMQQEGRISDIRSVVKELQGDIDEVLQDRTVWTGTREAFMCGKHRPSIGKNTTGTPTVLGLSCTPPHSSARASIPFSVLQKSFSSRREQKRSVTPVREDEYLRWCGTKETATRWKSTMPSTWTRAATRTKIKVSAQQPQCAYHHPIKWQ